MSEDSSDRSRAAHDLNQPLTALTLYLQAALMAAEKSGVTLPADVQGLIEKALAEAERAVDMAQRLR